MTRWAMLLSLVVTGGGAAFAADDDQRLVAFREICLPDFTDYAGLQATVEAKGWLPVGKNAHPGVAASLALARTVGEDPAIAFAVDAYAKTVGDRVVYAFVSESRIIDFDSEYSGHFIDCSVRDFDAEAPIAPETLSAWLAEEPSDVRDLGGGSITYVWGEKFMLLEPPGTWQVFDTYFSPGSKIAETMGFSGASFSKAMAM